MNRSIRPLLRPPPGPRGRIGDTRELTAPPQIGNCRPLRLRLIAPSAEANEATGKPPGTFGKYECRPHCSPAHGRHSLRQVYNAPLGLGGDEFGSIRPVRRPVNRYRQTFSSLAARSGELDDLGGLVVVEAVHAVHFNAPGHNAQLNVRSSLADLGREGGRSHGSYNRRPHTGSLR